jgi:hypothetical protein
VRLTVRVRPKAEEVAMERPLTKDNLLRQVDGLRDLARRGRHLAATLISESDQRRLERHVGELEDSASRLEQQAADAKAAGGSFAD